VFYPLDDLSETFGVSRRTWGRRDECAG